jgi:hypothetical protein
VIGGFLPFSAISVELYYIFATLWGREHYTLWGVLLLVLFILIAGEKIEKIYYFFLLSFVCLSSLPFSFSLLTFLLLLLLTLPQFPEIPQPFSGFSDGVHLRDTDLLYAQR